MELYKIIATITNTSSTFQLAYLPENFEGIKINQNFSFINPIGYTPKFSIETMRIIQGDKTKIDTVFNTYGLESDVEIEIQKLNSSGTGYEYLSTFAIDFESYEKFDFYSEFALKSVSTIDFYNNIKSTEQQIELTESAILPNTQKYINYISLKKNGSTRLTTYPAYVFDFISNNESKFYDKDTSLEQLYINSYIDKAIILKFGQTESVILNLSYSGKFEIDIDFGYTTNYEIAIYKGGDFSTKVHSIKSGTVTYDAFTDNRIFEIAKTKVTLASASYSSTNNLFVAVTFGSLTPINSINSDLFLDIKKATSINTISDNVNISAINADDLLSIIFNGNAVSSLSLTKITSARSLMGIDNNLIIKPTDFLNDLCLANGLVVNFALDGKVYLNTIYSFFVNVLNESNAIEITNFKDLSINYNTSLNFASVSVGQEISDYDVYTYLSDWNKILTFKQENRNASENLDLTLQKLRTDFSGILDYYIKRSQQKNTNTKDNFIFKAFTARSSIVPSISLYDYFTPRDILTNWKDFLSCCFQNFNKDTLTISSNGGTTDNLEISGVNQMDDLVLSSTPRLLPIQYNLTGLIDNVDFSKKIIKINDNGTDIYLFIFDAETTDNFNEQKISGLKIQF